VAVYVREKGKNTKLPVNYIFSDKPEEPAVPPKQRTKTSIDIDYGISTARLNCSCGILTRTLSSEKKEFKRTRLIV
jgi:hypothetical protein